MVYNILMELASNNSRNFKIDVLKREINNEELKRVLLAALNPNTQYYLKKIPNYQPAMEPEEIGYDLVHGLGMLHELSSRRVTGNKAIEMVKSFLELMSRETAHVMERIIEKDLKCGVSESTVNMVWPGFIPETPYMRCSVLKPNSKIDWSKGVYVQKKSDGMFQNISIDGTDVIFTSRNGKVQNTDKFPRIVNGLLSRFNTSKPCQLHGEMLVVRDGVVLPRQEGNGVLNHVLKGGDFAINEYPLYETWDMIPLEFATPDDVVEVDYAQRLYELERYVEGLECVQLVEYKEVFSYEEALEVYRDFLIRGFEGGVAKTKKNFWKDGTSKEQYKMKVVAECEMIILGLNPGNGKNKDLFGSIECESADGLVKCNVSGIPDKDIKEIFDNFETKYKGAILTVEYNQLNNPLEGTNYYRLNHPRFIEVRSDKNTANTLAEIKEIYESKLR